MTWDLQIRWRAVVLSYCYGLDYNTVAAILGPNEKTIRSWKSKFEKNGTVKDEPRNQPSRWNAEVLNWIKEYIEMDCTFLIEELQDELKRRFPNIRNVSASTICRALRHDLGLTRKVITKRAREMSSHELKSFMVRLTPRYSYPEQIVLLDETSKDGRDALRRYGWAPKGQ